MKNKVLKSLLVMTLVLTACQKEEVKSIPELKVYKDINQFKKNSHIVVMDVNENGFVAYYDGEKHSHRGIVTNKMKIAESFVLKDNSYQFNEKNIQYPLDEGYIVLVNGKYYYYPKKDVIQNNIVSEEVAKYIGMNPKLEGKVIVEEKEDGYLVQHGNHLDFIPKKKKNATETMHHDEEHHYEFNLNDVVSEDEQGYVVRHGDHYHYIFKSDTKKTHSDYEDHYEFNHNDVIKEDEHGYVVKHGNHYHYIPKISNHVPPKSENKDEEVLSLDEETKNKLTYLSETLKANLSDFKVVKRNGKLVVIWHHIDHEHEYNLDDIKVSPKIGNRDEPKENNDEPSKLTEEVKKKLIVLSELLKIKVEELKVVEKDGKLIAVWHHIDHDHEYALDQIQLNDTPKSDEEAEIQKQKEYIAFTYGVKVEAIRVSERNFVFNEPTHEYDPTHIHPFVLSRSRLSVPVVTGDAEIDFENELLAIANQFVMPVHKFKIENNKIIMDRGAHIYALNVKNIDGIKLYLDNKLPDIQGKYIEGEFKLEEVKVKVAEFRKEIDEHKVLTSKEKHRIHRALNEFEEKIEQIPSNSTNGYILMLDEFKTKYIEKQEIKISLEEQKFNEKYQAVLDLIQNTPLNELEKNKTQYVEELNKAALDKNYSKLIKIEHTILELKRLLDRPLWTQAQYLEHFIDNMDNSKLNDNLRNKVINLAFRLYQMVNKTGYEDMSIFLPEVVETKIQMAIALNQEKTYKHRNEMPYFELQFEVYNIRLIIGVFKPLFIGTMDTPIEILKP